jgi:alkylation response protein AidB-like acyl-CoA dehydrogenase
VHLGLNEQQSMLREGAERFMRNEYTFEIRRAALKGGDNKLSKSIGDLGWAAAALPSDCGGLGGSAVDLAILMEEMGRALYVGPFFSTSVCSAILQRAGGERAQSLLESAAAGQATFALAHTEPGSRGFWSTAKAQAVRSPDGKRWQLSGKKHLAYDAQFADLLIVSAEADGVQSLFLIDPSADGLKRRDFRTLDNGYASDLEFNQVDAEFLAGPEETVAALDAGFYALAVGLGAEAVGIAEACLKQAQDYVAVRKQFGKALTEFQVVQHRLADMFIDVEHLKASLLKALSCQEADRTTRRRAALAVKIIGGQLALKVAGDALHLHGGMGMSDEMPVSHFYRRARVIESQYGNSDYLLAESAKYLGT